VPDGGPGTPPESPPPQAGDPAAQAIQSVWTYGLDAQGQVVFGTLTLPLQGTGGTTAFNSLLDSASGTVIAATADFIGQATTLQPPAEVLANVVYFQNPATGTWDAVPLTAGQDTVLTPEAGSALTPLPSTDGLGVAWAVHDQNARVANGTNAAAVVGPPNMGLYPPGAYYSAYPPGTVVTIPGGPTYTFPGGVYLIYNPVDGGFWLIPISQPGTMVVPLPGGGTGNPVTQNPGEPFHVNPVQPGSGGGIQPGGPSSASPNSRCPRRRGRPHNRPRPPVRPTPTSTGSSTGGPRRGNRRRRGTARLQPRHHPPPTRLRRPRPRQRPPAPSRRG
jgi:hypothetical protein